MGASAIHVTQLRLVHMHEFTHTQACAHLSKRDAYGIRAPRRRRRSKTSPEDAKAAAASLTMDSSAALNIDS